MNKKITTDEGTSERLMSEGGYHQLSAQALIKRISGKTIRGNYLYGFTYVVDFDKDGSMEGINNVGSRNMGEWSVDLKDQSFTVKWDNGWDHTTTRAYDVAGKIKFYDCDTGLWRTTFYDFFKKT